MKDRSLQGLQAGLDAALVPAACLHLSPSPAPFFQVHLKGLLPPISPFLPDWVSGSGHGRAVLFLSDGFVQTQGAQAGG